jgi:hypothetical protein
MDVERTEAWKPPSYTKLAEGLCIRMDCLHRNCMYKSAGHFILRLHGAAWTRILALLGERAVALLDCEDR